MKFALMLVLGWLVELSKVFGIVAVIALVAAITSSWEDARKHNESKTTPTKVEGVKPTGTSSTSKVNSTSLYIPEDVMSHRSHPLWM